jgi:hypothetical protein
MFCKASTDLLMVYHFLPFVLPQVGRTARGRDGRGRALLMLMPEELGFLKYLKQAKV